VAPPAVVGASFNRTFATATALDAAGVVAAVAPWPEVACRGMRATLVGTSGDDIITGTPHADVIVGRNGADHIDGGGGDDVICGGPGDDAIEGGTGVDLLIGGIGNDHVDSDARDKLFIDSGTSNCSRVAIWRPCTD
jgi:Ca2+-binding RTX toxin-like protein